MENPHECQALLDSYVTIPVFHFTSKLGSRVHAILSQPLTNPPLSRYLLESRERVSCLTAPATCKRGSRGTLHAATSGPDVRGAMDVPVSDSPLAPFRETRRGRCLTSADARCTCSETDQWMRYHSFKLL